jgi:S-adenosyl-L-methionine hydrolase (adenosine-forming)
MVLIAILTDFGIKGQHYVAEMKGVGLQINPTQIFLDITHSIAPYSIIEAAYVLFTVYSTFPKGTIIVSVVDPGVGSPRDIVLIETNDNYYLIGPDNGIYSYFQQNSLIKKIIKIANPDYFYSPFVKTIKNELESKNGNREDKNNKSTSDYSINNEDSKTSSTFHGRDIMMPVAAHFSSQLQKNEDSEINNFGPVKNCLDVVLELEPQYDKIKNELTGIILYIDDFGNIIINISFQKYHKMFKSTSPSMKLIYDNQDYSLKVVKIFANNESNQLLFIKGSSRFMEICINQENAASYLSAKIGSTFKLKM